MEGLAWLLMKMAVLLALTGAAFLSLGWWLRGRQSGAASEPAGTGAGSSSTPVSRPELVEKIEHLRTSLRTLEADRDVTKRQLATSESTNETLRREIGILRSQLADAGGEGRATHAQATAAASPPPQVSAPASSLSPAGTPTASREAGTDADFALRSDEGPAAPASPPAKAAKPKAARKPRGKKR